MKRLFPLVLAVTVTGLFAGTAAAGRSAGTLLAVGDSITAGEGVPDGSQNERGYAAQLQRMMRGWIGHKYQGTRRRMALANIAVPGFRTTDVIRQLSDPALRDELANTDIRVVTLTIGGNDLRDVLHSGALNVCFGTSNMTRCERAAAAAFANVGARYRDIVLRLKALAPGADLVLVDQYNPFRKRSCDRTGNTLAVDRLLSSWNESVIAATAAAFDAHHVAIRQGFLDAGQAYHSSVDGDCLHPSGFGHRFIARSVERALLGY